MIKATLCVAAGLPRIGDLRSVDDFVVAKAHEFNKNPLNSTSASQLSHRNLRVCRSLQSKVRNLQSYR